MADYTGNFDLQLHVTDDNIVIVDTSNYVQSGTLPDGTFRGYIESIISPMGVEVYSNPYNSGNPPAADIDFSVSNKSTTEIEIPKFESGEIQTGNYSITVKIVGGGDTFTSTKLFSFTGYQQPELDLEVLFDCVTPNFSSEDKTNYTTTGGREPETITRLHTIDFPKDGVADLTGTDVKLETGTFYSTTQIVHFESEFYYDFGSDLYIYDKISTPESGFKKEVICISDLCQVYTLVDNLYTKLINARKVSGNPAQIERDWHESVGLLIMIREALNCGNSEGLDAYRERIEKLSGQCDCGCGETDEPVLITGWSSVDNNTVTIAYADQDNGFGFSFTPTSTTAFFGLFTHNKNYTPTKDDYNGLWIEFTSATATLHNELQGLQGGITDEYYHLTKSEYIQLKGILYQPPTLSLSPGSIGNVYEAGDLITITNQNISVLIGNPQNVYQNTLYYDGTSESPLPNNYELNFNDRFNTRGVKTISEAYIIRDDNLNQISDSVLVEIEYAVGYIAFPVSGGDLLNPAEYTDEEVTAILRGENPLYGGLETKILRPNKNIGNRTIDPIGLSNIYVFCPQEYGIPRISPQAFPTAYVNTTARNFIYTNNTAVIPSNLVRMDDIIGGQYLAKFS